MTTTHTIEVLVHPNQVMKGDCLTYGNGEISWIAQENARIIGKEVHLRVQHHPDGGLATRCWWDDPSISFTVLRTLTDTTDKE